MSSISKVVLDCANTITLLFRQTGELVEEITHKNHHSLKFTSPLYRIAHISIVDAIDSKKLLLMHVTIFPHVYNDAPIYGFDIIAGPNKVSGAFHDFSPISDKSHAMEYWFAEHVKSKTWGKTRELPPWAMSIFSNQIISIGAVTEPELLKFVVTGLDSLNYYLQHIHLTNGKFVNVTDKQNFYCKQQQCNPHTPIVLMNLGFTKEESQHIVHNVLFPTVDTHR